MTTAAVPGSARVRPQHDTLREGLIAGFIGATGVAGWLLVVDLIAARPFFTPSTLGYGLFSLFGTTPGSTAAAVLFYTVFHYAAFAAVGTLVVLAIHNSRSHPSILALMLMLFACFELGFLGLVAIMAETRLGGLAWYQVGLANLLATVLMGTYLWRRHPLLGRDFSTGLKTDELSESDRARLDG